MNSWAEIDRRTYRHSLQTHKLGSGITIRKHSECEWVGVRGKGIPAKSTPPTIPLTLAYYLHTYTAAYMYRRRRGGGADPFLVLLVLRLLSQINSLPQSQRNQVWSEPQRAYAQIQMILESFDSRHSKSFKLKPQAARLQTKHSSAYWECMIFMILLSNKIMKISDLSRVTKTYCSIGAN